MAEDLRLPAAFVALQKRRRQPQSVANDDANDEDSSAKSLGEETVVSNSVPPSIPSVAAQPLKPVATTSTTTTSLSGLGLGDDQVDVYGFKRRDGAPGWATPAYSVPNYRRWQTSYAAYCMKRKAKWVALLKDYGLPVPSDGSAPVRFPPPSLRLKRYIRKGIPYEWRGNAWFWYARGHDRLSAHAGLYARLVAETAELQNSDTEHIERDLHRTFPDNVRFRNDPVTDEESALLKAMRRVLRAFSVYQPKTGYCQSLNFIAGNLLLFIDEERAFWLLVIITQSYLAGLHEINLEQVNISQGILMISIRDRLPRVWDALALEESFADNFVSQLPPISLCTASWFMSLMVNVLPTETMLRVWDCFFFEGPKILFRISLAIFKLAEPAVLKASDEIEVFQAIQTTPRSLYDPTVLMRTCFRRVNGFGHISNEDIAVLRGFVQARRREVVGSESTDRDEYARYHPGRRLRARARRSLHA